MFCAFCFLPGELIANRAVSLYTAIKATRIFCRKINLPALLFPTLTMNLKGNILISTTDFGGVYLLQDVVSVSLPVNERMMIKKNHFEPYNLTGNEKRICIVTGIHGDELEGQYVCYELIIKLSENRHLLSGIVDIYPSMNPLGMDSIKREMPIFELDMNMIFPGSETGAVAEHIAAAIMNDIKGADICIDIHASNIFLREIPQVRISEETAPKLLPYAKMLNVDFIWVHSSVTVMEATLSHSLNKEGTPTLVAEMGVGMRITKSYGDQLLDGIFNLMAEMGIWTGETKKVSHPIVSTDGNVSFIYSDTSGIFMPAIKHWAGISKGDHIGDILDPLSGAVEQEIFAPCSGIVFTLREYPVVYEGSLLARILGGC